MPDNNQIPQTHTFNPSNDTEIIRWLAQHDTHELPPMFRSFKLSPIQSSLGMSWIIVCLANLACDFQPNVYDDTNHGRNGMAASSVTFSKQEHLRFQELQSNFHNTRFHHLTNQLGYDPNTAASLMGGTLNSQGLLQQPPLLTLSPRMIIENDTERMSMKHVLLEFLNEKAEQAERRLLRDLEADEKNLEKKASKKKKKKVKQQMQQKENHSGKDCNVQKELIHESKKSVRFQEHPTLDDLKGIEPMKTNRENAIGKDVLTTDLSIEVPKSNDILAHLMVPLKIDYEDRVSETALQNPLFDLGADANRESMIMRVSPSERDHENSELSFLVTENELLKAEIAKLRREIEASRQKSTEAIQRVQLKAYIAETARDSAQERAGLLEALLVEVFEGKTDRGELEELFLSLKAQTSPTATSSLSSILGRLPNDTFISINCSQGKNQNQIQQELQIHHGVLSRLRRRDNDLNKL